MRILSLCCWVLIVLWTVAQPVLALVLGVDIPIPAQVLVTIALAFFGVRLWRPARSDERTETPTRVRGTEEASSTDGRI